MLQYQFRPIDQWPGTATKSRARAQFRSSWNRTLDLLEHELQHLVARDVVIQADVELPQLRNDGMLRSGCEPRTPRVIVAFDSKHGPLSYPCDRYTDWKANVHAIALALEALRAVDRYGVTRQAEQYKGWAKLPAPNAPMSRQEAAAILSEHSGYPASDILGSHSVFVEAARKAMTRTHPDAGGNADDAKRVNAARQVLS